MSNVDPAVQVFLALLTHELRNPIGAITGYQELLADGLYGELEEGGVEALARIRNAGDQLLSLLDGVNELMKPGSSLNADMLYVPPDEIIARAIESAQQLAVGRGAKLNAPPPEGLDQIRTDPERLCRALDLALGAAVRGSPGADLHISYEHDPDGVQHLLVHGTALDPERDDPALQIIPEDTANGSARAISTGPGLRLAMAKRLATSIGGDVDLQRDGDSTTLKIRLGNGIDSREAAP
jgi:signal transduction histidine kinase